MELGESIKTSTHDIIFPIYATQSYAILNVVDHQLHSLIIDLLRRPVYMSVNNSVRSGIVDSLTSNELKLW